MSTRWRGTVVYVCSLVVIGAAAFARYGGTPVEEVAPSVVSPVVGPTAAASPSGAPPG
ncbi:hypothetical protein [Antribacter gilvus]|uniref:hypothetical protein n=1 Tax=Antribacter gilvus TaxID=2304675 RepID=UPI0013DFA217|nr:hypothetical protein [Antribacter gilvus]